MEFSSLLPLLQDVNTAVRSCEPNSIEYNTHFFPIIIHFQLSFWFCMLQSVVGVEHKMTYNLRSHNVYSGVAQRNGVCAPRRHTEFHFYTTRRKTKKEKENNIVVIFSLARYHCHSSSTQQKMGLGVSILFLLCSFFLLRRRRKGK